MVCKLLILGGKQFHSDRLLETFLCGLAGELGVSQALSYNLAHKAAEAVAIVQGQAVVVAENLLVNIAEQVEWFDRNVGPAQAAFQQPPEVLDPVGVNVAVDVGLHVIDDFVVIVGLEPEVGLQLVGEDVSALLDVLFGTRVPRLLSATTIALILPPRCKMPCTPVLSEYPPPLPSSARALRSLCMFRALPPM